MEGCVGVSHSVCKGPGVERNAMWSCVALWQDEVLGARGEGTGLLLSGHLEAECVGPGGLCRGACPSPGRPQGAIGRRVLRGGAPSALHFRMLSRLCVEKAWEMRYGEEARWLEREPRQVSGAQVVVALGMERSSTDVAWSQARGARRAWAGLSLRLLFGPWWK